MRAPGSTYTSSGSGAVPTALPSTSTSAFATFTFTVSAPTSAFDSASLFSAVPRSPEVDAKSGQAWWVGHLENVYALHWLSVQMPDDSSPDFVVEISNDQTHWRQVAEVKERRKNHEIGLFDGDNKAAFLRIRFPAVTPDRPAQLSEVRVFAKPKN